MGRVHIIKVDNFAVDSARYLYERFLAIEGTVTLAGGTTPRAVYEQLNNFNCESLFDKLTFILGDERLVPAGDVRSNAQMIASAWPKLLVQFPDLSSTDVVSDYNRQLKFENIALAILGIGNDFHTCSLFPSNELDLGFNSRFIKTHNEGDGTDRLSLSPKFLASANEKVLLASGEVKGKILRELLRQELECRTSISGGFEIEVDNSRINQQFQQYPSLLGLIGECAIIVDDECYASLLKN